MSDIVDSAADDLVPAEVLASSSPVAVYGSAQARPGKEHELEDLIKSVLPRIITEDGCEQYAVHTTEQNGLFTFYERWSSGAALAQHNQQQFMQEYFAKVPELLGAAPEATWITPLHA